MFNQWCLHMLLGIKWYQAVWNDVRRRPMKQPKLTAIIQSRRLTLFGHIARVDDNADAKRILLASPLIIIMIITTMFMVLSSWQSHCESSPGSFDECRTAPSGRRPKTKSDDLGCESACTGCQKLHPPSPFIIITEPES